jgi:molybdenum cofactor cytidylyltransferase
MNAATQRPVGVIILGAGASVRMGTPKLLLPWRGSTVIGHLLAQWRELGAAQIAVVLRAGDTALAAELDRLHLPECDRIANPQPERGMFSSVVCAANWTGWRADISRWAIVLGDQPHLHTETLRGLLEFSGQHPAAICQPALDGHTGHPVILPAGALAELKHSPAATLKEFMQQTSGPRLSFCVPDAGLLLDMDTPADYQQLLTPQ